MSTLRLLSCAALVLTTCGGDKAAPQPVPAPAVPVVAPGDRQAGSELREATEQTLRTHIQSLADDTFQGRRPGTEGGRQTELYVEAQMKHLGLLPAGEADTYRQRVPMRGVTLDLAAAQFEVRGGTGPAQRLSPSDQIVATSFAAAQPWSLQGEVVFAGYGITAPEYEWDDYAGVDVTNKIVVVLVGDPPVADGRFHGKSMTYYGRWSYKFERALQAGALACLVVHEPGPAAYGWNVVRSSWSGERFGLREPDDSLPAALGFQGWIHRDAAEALAARAGSDLAAWHARAEQPGFTAQPTGLTLAATFATTDRTIEANNIIGKIPGTTAAAQAVIITAHWDHLGLSEPLVDGDAVFNGAIDNASGVAGMLATAAALRGRVRDGRDTARSVVFLATTAEEQGLLGSRYYADHPLIPIDEIVAAINLDSMNVDGRTNSVVVVGAGQSTLEDTLAEVVATQGRHTVPDDKPEGGGYYRSDQFSFARRGVPALYFRGSTDLQEGGLEAGAQYAKERAERYHTVADQYDPTWSLQGTLQDVEALVELVVRVANAEPRPAWKAASEFAGVK